MCRRRDTCRSVLEVASTSSVTSAHVDEQSRRNLQSSRAAGPNNQASAPLCCDLCAPCNQVVSRDAPRLADPSVLAHAAQLHALKTAPRQSCVHASRRSTVDTNWHDAHELVGDLVPRQRSSPVRLPAAVVAPHPPPGCRERLLQRCSLLLRGHYRVRRRPSHRLCLRIMRAQVLTRSFVHSRDIRVSSTLATLGEGAYDLYAAACYSRSNHTL